MKNAKKLLCTVLSLCMIASTIVLPVSVKAEDYIINESFDGLTETKLFGTTVNYQLVGGGTYLDGPDSDKVPLGLKAGDTVLMLTGRNNYFNQNGYDKFESVLADPTKTGWGAESNLTHATYEMDFWINDLGATFAFSSGTKDRYGFIIGTTQDSSTKTGPVKIVHGDSAVSGELARVGRREWHRVAVEYDYTSTPYTMRLYLNNELLDTQELTEKTTVPVDMNIYGDPKNDGHIFVNNFKFYEGAYRPSALPIPFDWDYTADVNAVDGLAGKSASDKVLAITGSEYRPNGYGARFSGVAGNIATYEASVYVPAGKEASYRIWNGAEPNENRIMVKFDGGKVYYGTNISSASGATTEVGTYDVNTWNKIALVRNKADNTWTIYVNGELLEIATVTGDAPAPTVWIKDFGFYNIEAPLYVDNLRFYGGNYAGDAAITAVSTAKVTVSGTTLSALEGVTLDDLKAAITAYDQVKFYTDATLETETSDVKSAGVMLVKYGELYKTYTINVVTKYDGAYYENTFDTVDQADSLNADAATYPSTIETNVAGRADRVAKILNANNPAGVGTWGQVWNTDKFTAEIMVYNPNHLSMGILPSSGNLATTANRNGINLQADGTIKMYKQNVQQETTATYDMDKWTKVAYTVCHSEDTMKIYVDGVLVYTYENLGTDGATYGKDIRLTPSSKSGIYLDNFRCYSGDYKGDDAVVFTATSDITVADGVMIVKEGTTLADIKATFNTDNVAIYTDRAASATSAVADGAVVIANKGELYQTYTIDVLGLYDDAYLLTGFESQAIVNEGTGFGLASLTDWLYANNRNKLDENGEIVYKTDNEGNLELDKDGNPIPVTESRKDEVTTSYVTGLGGNESTVYKVTAPATETYRNVRFQTGYGNPSTHVTEAGVYTYEADIYRGAGASNGASIMVKMRNTTDSNNIQITLPTPSTGNRWYKLAITVDTVNKTVKGYINGVDFTPSLTFFGTDYDAETYEVGTLVFSGKDYTVVSDQVNVNFSDSKTAEVVTATDNMRLYPGAYRGTTAPSMATKVSMAENSTVADVIAETGADFVVDANGNVVSSTAAAVATGYQAVKVDGEMFGYTAIEVEVAAPDTIMFNSTPLAVEHYKGANGVDYIMMPVVTEDVVAIEEYKTFVFKAGDDTRAISLTDLPDFTTVDGAVNIGILVMNVPAAAENNWKAMITKQDLADMAKPE